MMTGFSSRENWGDLGHKARGGLCVCVEMRWGCRWCRVSVGEKTDVAWLDSSVGNQGCEGKEGECHFIFSSKSKYGSNCG